MKTNLSQYIAKQAAADETPDSVALAAALGAQIEALESQFLQTPVAPDNVVFVRGADGTLEQRTFGRRPLDQEYGRLADFAEAVKPRVEAGRRVELRRRSAALLDWDDDEHYRWELHYDWQLSDQAVAAIQLIASPRDVIDRGVVDGHSAEHLWLLFSTTLAGCVDEAMVDTFNGFTLEKSEGLEEAYSPHGQEARASVSRKTRNYPDTLDLTIPLFAGGDPRLSSAALTIACMLRFRADSGFALIPIGHYISPRVAARNYIRTALCALMVPSEAMSA